MKPFVVILVCFDVCAIWVFGLAAVMGTAIRDEMSFLIVVTIQFALNVVALVYLAHRAEESPHD